MLIKLNFFLLLSLLLFIYFIYFDFSIKKDFDQEFQI